MIEYLEQLVIDKQYEQASKYAERLLLDRNTTLPEITAVNCALLKARLELGELHGAAVSGELAAKLAEDLEQWDYYGTATFLMGAVHLILRQPNKALSSCLSYLEKLSLYRTAGKYESFAWFNIGLSYLALGDIDRALDAEFKALQTALRAGDERTVHGIRHGLISLYMRSGNLAPIPRLLAKCAHYLRHHRETESWKDSWLWHYMLRTEFAVVTDRLKRAKTVANHGLKLSHRAPLQRYHLHMVLAQIARRQFDIKEAVSRSLSARVCAMTCRRYDLESEAADFLYGLTKTDPGVLQEIEQHFSSEVLDFAVYFPES